jgi:hypothetical protein
MNHSKLFTVALTMLVGTISCKSASNGKLASSDAEGGFATGTPKEYDFKFKKPYVVTETRKQIAQDGQGSSLQITYCFLENTVNNSRIRNGLDDKTVYLARETQFDVILANKDNSSSAMDEAIAKEEGRANNASSSVDSEKVNVYQATFKLFEPMRLSPLSTSVVCTSPVSVDSSKEAARSKILSVLETVLNYKTKQPPIAKSAQKYKLTLPPIALKGGDGILLGKGNDQTIFDEPLCWVTTVDGFPDGAAKSGPYQVAVTKSVRAIANQRNSSLLSGKAGTKNMDVFNHEFRLTNMDGSAADIFIRCFDPVDTNSNWTSDQSLKHIAELLKPRGLTEL